MRQHIWITITFMILSLFIMTLCVPDVNLEASGVTTSTDHSTYERGDLVTISVVTPEKSTITIQVFDPDGDLVNISSITILTSSGSTIIDPDPNDLCFDYIPAANFTGIDSVEIVVCDNGIISLCDTVIAIIDVINSPIVLRT